MDSRDDKLIIFLVRLLKIKIASHFCALHLEVQIVDYVFGYFREAAHSARSEERRVGKECLL